ncbi:MAG: M42 family metallopeptidase [Flammeovirgaceae bacterium]
MKKSSEKFLFKYLKNASPTGFETPGQQLWLEYLSPYIDEHFTDTYGTAVGVINPGQDYKVVIEAHADEISWFVNYISPDGYIYVIRNGGSDHQIAPSKRVHIHTKKGIVNAVFGWPAIHVRRNGTKEEAPSLDNIFLDCGCNSKEEVEKLGVKVGCVVTFVDEPEILNKNYIMGRALDNRIGGFIIAEVARKLKEKKKTLPFSLYIVNSVQEEIGLRGAQMIAERIQPDVAIITDVCHDTTAPMYNKQRQGETQTGKGPVLVWGPAVHNNLRDMILEVAEKKKIDYQRMAISRATGTDTDAFAYSNAGVASALISLTLKYMHTTVEMVHKDDVQACINLMYEFLIQLPNQHDFSYVK